MKPCILAIFGLLAVLSCQADHQNPDSFDVTHYDLNLAVDFQQQSLRGHAGVTFTPTQSGLEAIELSLLGFAIDSIKQNGQQLNHNYNDTNLRIDFAQPINPGDTNQITVFYEGEPAQDPSGWGGFYFRSGTAFNMGVGFEANPHPFGRAWFPCRDQFTERATYDFHIRADSSKKAFCNGLLVDSTIHPDSTITWHWQMTESIPSYLASMAVGPYETVRSQHQGQNNAIPVVYGVKESDSADMKTTFEHIGKAIDVFEEFYGPHRFSRVGFNVVPFNSGAMEHATNIAFPSNQLNASRNDETLYAHELAHHWWGDLVTTHRAEEMWINEGWASFSEYIFLEAVYGREAYFSTVRSNHKDILDNAHERDAQYRPLVPVPHDYTYGMHSYRKGADVIHTLRTYLGDAQFKSGLQQFLADHAFEAVSSAQLRDSLSSYTGYDLTPFFDNWVFSKGFPHFSFDHWTVNQQGSQYQVEGTVQQKLYEAPEYYEDVPLTISYFNDNWNRVTREMMVSGTETDFSHELPFDPELVVLDLNGKISDAQTSVARTINQTGNYDLQFADAEMGIEVNNAPDSAYIVAKHHWVEPDPFQGNNPGIRLSDYRYWTVKGIWPEEFNVTASLDYNESDYPDGLDLQHEDSFVVMHRPDPNSEWRVYEDYEASIFGTSNGSITLNNLQQGDYCFAKYDENAVGLEKEASPSGSRIEVFPNPAGNKVKIRYQGNTQLEKVEVQNQEGRMILEKAIKSKNTIALDTTGWAKGTYVIRVRLDDQSYASKKFIIRD